MTKKILFAVLAALALPSCTTITDTSAIGIAPRCDSSPASTRKTVLAFYNVGLVGRDPHAAFMRYMAPDFVEHKPDVPNGTREATSAFLSQVMAEVR
jgi:hypothetical protein